MKILIISILALFVSFSSFSQNNLVIFSDDGEKFIMFVNNERQNEMPQANVKAENITQEGVRVKLAFNNKGIPELTKTLYFQESGKEYTFVLKQNRKGKYVLRLMSTVAIVEEESEVELDDNTIYETPIVVENSGNTEMKTTVVKTETTSTTTTNSSPGGETSFSMSVGEEGVSVDLNEDEMGETISFDISVEGSVMDTETGVASSTTTTTTTTYNESITVVETDTEDYASSTTNHVSTGACDYPVSNTEFSDISKSLKSKTFEDSKLTTAKQIAKNKCLLAAQVRDIMEMFDFEDTRLEFAKFAYEYVYDADNYYQVNDAFEYELSIDELNEYIELK